MDRKPPHRPAPLLDDLESIRNLLDERSPEPPLLTDILDAEAIPLLSEIVEPALTQRLADATPAQATAERRGNDELRAAAELVLEEVLDEFLPQVEIEFRRRLKERLASLIRTRPAEAEPEPALPHRV